MQQQQQQQQEKEGKERRRRATDETRTRLDVSRKRPFYVSPYFSVQSESVNNRRSREDEEMKEGGREGERENAPLEAVPPFVIFLFLTTTKSQPKRTTIITLQTHAIIGSSLK